MINRGKSQTYLYVRENPAPHVDLQNIKTIRALIHYRRQTLLGMFHQAHDQVKVKAKQFKDHAINVGRGEDSKGKKVVKKIEEDIETISTHSYE